MRLTYIVTKDTCICILKFRTVCMKKKKNNSFHLARYNKKNTEDN